MTENGDLNLTRQSFVCIRRMFCRQKSLKHLSCIELGILKFAVVKLIWCENFIESELNAIILKRGLAQV